jgi:hypothetical protein
MIRVCDGLGRVKQEIDTSSDYYLHVSYVREHLPYTEFFDSDRPAAPEGDVWRDEVTKRQVEKRAETMRQRKASS